MHLAAWFRRPRLWLASVALLSVVAVVSRRHLYVLGQVLYTYVVFYQQNHVVLDFPTDKPSFMPLRNNSNVVPRIMHQIWLDEHHPPNGHPQVAREDADVAESRDGLLALPHKYWEARTCCTELHPGWEFKLWTDLEATEFVKEWYPQVFEHYVGYRQTIQRTNILRYLVLHHFGGVYLDLDIRCRTSLEGLLWVPWITPAAYPAGINNAFILSEPRHPFLTSVISEIGRYDMSWPLPYLENMFSTGCMFISMQYARFGGWDKRAARMRILGSDGEMEPQMLRGHVVTPLFEHGGESSWHSWDGQWVVLAGRYWRLLVFCIGMLTVVFCALSWKLSRKRPRFSTAKGMC